MFTLTRVATARCLGRPVHAHEAERGSYACSFSLSSATLDLAELAGKGMKRLSQDVQ